MRLNLTITDNLHKLQQHTTQHLHLTLPFSGFPACTCTVAPYTFIIYFDVYIHWNASDYDLCVHVCMSIVCMSQKVSPERDHNAPPPSQKHTRGATRSQHLSSEGGDASPEFSGSQNVSHFLVEEEETVSHCKQSHQQISCFLEHRFGPFRHQELNLE